MGSNGSQSWFTLLALSFRLYDFEQPSFSEPLSPCLGMAMEPNLQGFCKNWMRVVYLSAGADEAYWVFVDGDHSCPSREATGWFVFGSWWLFLRACQVFIFQCFIFLSWIPTKGHRKEGKNRHEKNSPHLTRFCGEHKTTSTLLTDEVCFSLIRRLRRKFYLDGFLLCSGDRFLQGHGLVNQHMAIHFLLSSWEFKKQISSWKISSVMLRIP